METTEFDAIGHHVKKGKRGACEQKAATVLPNCTGATYCICSSLSSFKFNIAGYGHLMMLEHPLRLHPCRLCHGNSEILDRRSFRIDATLFFI